MTRRAARGGSGWAALAAGLVLLMAGCSDDGGAGSPEPGGSSSSGTDAAPVVVTNTTLEGVSGRLDRDKRQRVKEDVNQIVDQWFDGAFLGEFPRSNYRAAFAGFTDGARSDAMRALDLMSNQAIAGRIDTATATHKRVRLEVLAPDGRPRGATARFVLNFRTTGELEGPRRVAGSLYLTNQTGEWHVFGYDVLEGVSR